MAYPTGSIQVTNAIGTTASTDVYPTHYDFLGSGGLMTVDTLANRNLIPALRRRFGMFVTVYADPTPANNTTYRLSNVDLGGVNGTITDNANWVIFQPGGGSGTDVVEEVFTANGTDTIFTVSTGTIDFLNFVDVNGDVQRVGIDFTLSGQDLDFGTAPNSGDVITVRFFEGFSLASSGYYQTIYQDSTPLTQRDRLTISDGLTAVDEASPGQTIVKLGGAIRADVVLDIIPGIGTIDFTIGDVFNNRGFFMTSNGFGDVRTTISAGSIPGAVVYFGKEDTIAPMGMFQFRGGYHYITESPISLFDVVAHEINMCISTGGSSGGNGFLLTTSVFGVDPVGLQYHPENDMFDITLDPTSGGGQYYGAFFKYVDDYYGSYSLEDRWIPDMGAVRSEIAVVVNNITIELQDDGVSAAYLSAAVPFNITDGLTAYAIGFTTPAIRLGGIIQDTVEIYSQDNDTPDIRFYKAHTTDNVLHNFRINSNGFLVESSDTPNGAAQIFISPGQFSMLADTSWSVSVAATQRILVDSIGAAFSESAATAFVDIGGSTTAAASLRIRTGTAPTGGALLDGTIWNDGTDLKMRIGGVTKTFTLI